MAFDFPNSPALGATYAPPTGGIYTWNGYAWVKQGSASGSAAGGYVLKAGDVMTGPLTLPGDPVSPLHAAPKQYVDATSSLPVGGNPGDALVKNIVNVPEWGAIISGGSF